MIITVKKNDQTAGVTIDTEDCRYPYAIKDAFKLALELDGYTKETINEVFGIMDDVKCVSSEQD